MSIPHRSPVDEVKERLDIVEVIGGYVKLQKAGANYRAPCPFHAENSPSFFVSPSKQIWHCFGACSEGGDVISFVQNIEGVEFREALRMLAERAGVKLQRQDEEQVNERKRLSKLCELACKWFEKHRMEAEAGKAATRYLHERGFTDESIEKWRLGFAPDEWRKLSQFLTSRGYAMEEIVKTGLLIEKQDEGRTKRYDRFRSRIIFPVFDLSGRVIGFGGRRFIEGNTRTISEDSPKYLNTPNTPLYDKSSTLYGLDKAKVAIRRENRCILVEGYADTIMASQAGTEHVVATSGTSLTEQHLTILKRYTDTLLLAFDMDLAGDNATRRGIEMAQSHGFDIKVADMPEDKDPADLVAEGAEVWHDTISHTKDIVAYYFDTAFGAYGEGENLDPQQKARIGEELLPVIARLPNKIVQSQWLEELANRLDVKEEALEQELRHYRQSAAATKSGERESSIARSEKQEEKKSRRALLEEWVLALLLRAPNEAGTVRGELAQLLSDENRPVLSMVADNAETIAEHGITEAAVEQLDEAARKRVTYLAMKGEVEEVSDVSGEVRRALSELYTIGLRERLAEISDELKTAEQEGDTDRVSQLLQEFDTLSQQLNQ